MYCFLLCFSKSEVEIVTYIMNYGGGESPKRLNYNPPKNFAVCAICQQVGGERVNKTLSNPIDKLIGCVKTRAGSCLCEGLEDTCKNSAIPIQLKWRIAAMPCRTIYDIRADND